MEDENLGTKATRADIIEILYRRGYVKDQRMQATTLAIKVIGLLDKYCRLIIEPGFTGRLEDLMDQIQVGKTSRRRVLLEALDHLRPVMLDLVDREEEFGESLGETVTAQRVMEVTFETPCPECGSKLRSCEVERLASGSLAMLVCGMGRRNVVSVLLFHSLVRYQSCRS